MEKFTLGFVFNSDSSKVLLIHKQKPDWQSGRINGIGGKIEAGESALDCIVRECQEECLLDIPRKNWYRYALIEQAIGDVVVFAAKFSKDMSGAKQNDYEMIEWFDTLHLPSNALSNLQWLILMAKQILDGEKFNVQIAYCE